MKIQIRQGLFETNSSSVHAIAIRRGTGKSGAKKYLEKKGADLEVECAEYGWEFRTHSRTDSKIAYAFALATYARWNKYQKYKRFMEGQLKALGFKPKFPEMEERHYDGDTEGGDGGWPYPKDGSYCGVDHGDDWDNDFLDKLFTDPLLFRDFIFGDAWVFTGNDNTGRSFREYVEDMLETVTADQNNLEKYYKGN